MVKDYYAVIGLTYGNIKSFDPAGNIAQAGDMAKGIRPSQAYKIKEAYINTLKKLESENWKTHKKYEIPKEVLRVVKEAYALLSDSVKREEYNKKMGFDSQQDASVQNAALDYLLGVSVVKQGIQAPSFKIAYLGNRA